MSTCSRSLQTQHRNDRVHHQRDGARSRSSACRGARQLLLQGPEGKRQNASVAADNDGDAGGGGVTGDDDDADAGFAGWRRRVLRVRGLIAVSLFSYHHGRCGV